MPAHVDLRATGNRIEQLLAELQASADPRCYDQAEELARSITELYGAALVRVVELIRDRDPGLGELLAGDDLVASLLVVHGIHPRSVAERVEDALREVRPMLAARGGDVELAAIDADRGTARLLLHGSCDGGGSSAGLVQTAVERAVTTAAPEIVHVEVEPALAVPARRPVVPAVVPVFLGAKPRHATNQTHAGQPAGEQRR
jgi:Fe-S cluster biogenesis protein NfuA